MTETRVFPLKKLYEGRGLSTGLTQPSLCPAQDLAGQSPRTRCSVLSLTALSACYLHTAWPQRPRARLSFPQAVSEDTRHASLLTRSNRHRTGEDSLFRNSLETKPSALRKKVKNDFLSLTKLYFHSRPSVSSLLQLLFPPLLALLCNLLACD